MWNTCYVSDFKQTRVSWQILVKIYNTKFVKIYVAGTELLHVDRWTGIDFANIQYLTVALWTHLKVRCFGMTIMSTAFKTDNVMALWCGESGIFQLFTYKLHL
jgi:hypothetical protein